MLHTKFPASKPSNFEEKDFIIFSMYFYGLSLGPPGTGPSWILGLLFKPKLVKDHQAKYIPNFKL